MSGTINLAFTQQFDAQGDPLSGGLLTFYVAGSTTLQTPFQDTALSIAHPNPIVLDASGRVPMFYIADGFIKIRLTDKNGVVIIAADQLLVIGPSSGSSGSSTGDVTRQFDTGDIKARYDNRSINGWVRCNGNTIGQTGSGATEPNGIGANAQALYEYLYQFTSILLADGAVKSGNAVTDFGANKKLILPDLRGRVIAGLDDMGALAGAALRLTSTYFGTPTTVLGAVGGDEKHKLIISELPKVTPAGSVTKVEGSSTDVAGSGGFSGSILADTANSISGTASGIKVSGNTGNTPGGATDHVMAGSQGGSGVNVDVGNGSVAGTCAGNVSGTGGISSGTASFKNGTGTFTGTEFGADGNHTIVSPAMVMNIYIKL